MKTQLTTLLTALALTASSLTASSLASQAKAPQPVPSSVSATRLLTTMQRLDRGGEFSMFAAALAASGVDKILKSGTYTLLAPNNAAFGKVPQSTMDMLMFEGNEDLLRQMVLYHIVPGTVTSERLKKAGSLHVLMARHSLGATAGDWKLPSARMIAFDIQTSGGMIHAIDSVLIPEQPFAAN